MAWQGNGVGATWERHAMCESAISELPASGVAMTAVSPNVTGLSYLTACTITHKGVLI